MPFTTITNDQKWVFVDTAGKGASESSHTWARLGEGINSFNPSNNGQVDTKHYINAKFATSRRNGLQKQFSFSGDRIKGDSANDYLVGLAEKTGEDVESSVLVFEMVDGTPYGSGSGVYYNAKVYNCMIDMSNEGSIEGGQSVAIDGTLYINGDPIEGYVTLSNGAPTFSTTVPTT